jgi:hypothetical protein
VISQAIHWDGNYYRTPTTSTVFFFLPLALASVKHIKYFMKKVLSVWEISWGFPYLYYLLSKADLS